MWLIFFFQYEYIYGTDLICFLGHYFWLSAPFDNFYFLSYGRMQFLAMNVVTATLLEHWHSEMLTNYTLNTLIQTFFFLVTLFVFCISEWHDWVCWTFYSELLLFWIWEYHESVNSNKWYTLWIGSEGVQPLANWLL